MQKPFRILVVLVLAALAFWGWWAFFPSPERAIRSRLQEVAETASFENEGNIAKGYNAQKLASFFTLDATVNMDVRGYPAQNIEGRDEIQKTLFAVRQVLRALKVEFLDINVTLDPDKQSALANLTAKAIIGGQGDPVFQELNFHLKKVDGNWQISGVETVSTLSGISNFEFRISSAAQK